MTTPSNSQPENDSRKQQLSEAKRALLAKRIKGRKGAPANQEASPSPSLRAIPSNATDAPNVASFAQERLWFLQQLHPTSAAYNMHGIVRIRGALNVEAFQTSLNRVIARHQILRTVFTVSNGQIIQQVKPELTIGVHQIDLTCLPTAEREDEAMAQSVAESRLPFDLEKGPLFRASLLKINSDHFIVRLTLHHIISDEWSTGLLWEEIAQQYSAEFSGQSIELPPLPIQYVDYAHWQRQQSEARAAAAQLDYWCKQLAPNPDSGTLPVLEFPASKPRPASQSQEGALVSRTFSSELGSQLRELSRQHQTTLFNTMLAAFVALLYRYTGQTDLLIGTPIANRNHPDVANLIGFFINTLVIRTDLNQIGPSDENATPTFTQLLNHIRQTTLEAISNQDLPFERLVEELHPQRDQGRNPIFQAMFVHQTDQTKQVQLPELTLEQVHIDSQVAKFDLTLFINESGDNLSAAIEYSTDLFEQPAIERMLGHLETMIAAIALKPNASIADLPLLTPAEEQQLIGQWSGVDPNSPATKKVHDKRIHHLFEELTQRQPDVPAIAYDDVTLSYHQLNQQADALSAQLNALGLHPNTFIAICAERSPEMFIAILAVLKANCAYVPIDPSYPAERIAYILEDTAAPIILTNLDEDKHGLTPSANYQIIDIHTAITTDHRPPTTDHRPPTTDHRPPTTDHHFAYVIYTSGSTGKPKGVTVTHANLVHSTTARFDAYPDPVGRFLLLSSFAFDSSIVGIFWTLCQGGTLVLPKQGEEKEIQLLGQLIQLHQVTHLLALPSLYGLLIDYAQPEQLQTVTTAVVAGEACTPELVARHFATIPYARLYNEYGPTEGTVWSTFCELVPDDTNSASIPIGRPIPNMQNYILDQHCNLLPVGIPGELVIAGSGITPGYLNQPELTDKRFRAIPARITQRFAENRQKIAEKPEEGNEKSRGYWTGDLVRWREDGRIEFLGRIDQQVKIRGVRIELGEIESALLESEGVQASVAHVARDVDAREQLVGFVVWHPVSEKEQHFDESVHQSYLRERLPQVMLPGRIFCVDKLPQTPNGKVDRNQLNSLLEAAIESAPTRIISQTKSSSMSSAAHRSTQDELEIQLTAIWESVLKTKPIGLYDDYFDLGGHSLQAVHLFQRIREQIGQDIPLASLFETPTIYQQAELLRQDGWTPHWSVLVPIQPQGSKPPLFCAHAVGGNVLSLRSLAQKLGSDQPFYAFQSQGLDGKETIPERVEEMAAYYIHEMRTVQPQGPYHITGQSSGGLVAYEMARQLAEDGEDVQLLGLIDTYLPVGSLSQASVDSAHIDTSLGANLSSSQQNGTSQPSTAPAIPLARRLQFHLEKIGQHGLTHITESAKTRAVKTQIRTRRAIENRFVRTIQNYYSRSGRPLPPRFRPIYVRTAVEKAILNYRPQRYRGDIVLFRATASIDAYLESIYGSPEGWSQITDGEVHEVNIEGGHNLEQEPAVGILAEKLNEWLQQA